jgi:hypothetical protein
MNGLEHRSEMMGRRRIFFEQGVRASNGHGNCRLMDDCLQ